MSTAKSALHDLAKVNIFNERNLPIWKRRMAALLHIEGLSYVIKEKTRKKPADDASKEEKDLYVTWEYDNESVRNLFLGFISDDLVKQFEQLASAKEIYDQIIAKYDAITVSHLMEAFLNYVNYKVHKGTLINDHID
ncbi:hypothetical protein AAC387_Pa01g2698 [Persea americana]